MACFLVAKSCPTLCDPRDCSLPGSFVHGIFQARIMEWATFPSPRHFPTQGSNPHLLSPGLAGRFFITEPPGKPWIALDRRLRVFKYICEVLTILKKLLDKDSEVFFT